MISFRRFIKGILLKGETSDPSDNLEGSVFHNSTSNRIKAYIEAAVRTFVTEDQTQTLTNKSVDADNNTISNLETDNLKAGVLNTDTAMTGASDAQVPSALAIKTYVDDSIQTKDEASEIGYDNSTSGLAATDVQAAIDEVEGRLDTAETGLSDHLADASDAHDSSAISYNNATSGLTATDAQAAIDEVEGRLDTAETNISNNATAVSDHLADPTDAHAASAITNTPTGNLTSTDVQAALNELQTDIDGIDVSGKADTDLGNITTITSNLIANVDTLDIGNAGTPWDRVYKNSSWYYNSGSLQRRFAHNITSPSGSTTNFAETGNTETIMMTDNRTSTTESQPIAIETGNTENAASGDIRLRPGVPSGSGTRGVIDATSANISNVADPVANQDAATKAYVDAQGGGTKNYLAPKNAKFEESSDDWAEYNDGGAASTDGTGGTATQVVLSYTTTASEVLEGSQTKKIAVAASAQGEGASVTT